MKRYLLTALFALTTIFSFAQDILVITKTDNTKVRIKLENISTLTFASSSDIQTIIGKTSFPTTTSFQIEFETTQSATKAGIRYGLGSIEGSDLTATSLNADNTSWTATAINGIDFNTTYTVQAYAMIEGSEYTSETITVTTPSKFPVADVVDMGLPSGVKWSSFNMGAANPESVGLYLPWGDVTGEAYDVNTYPKLDIKVNNISGTSFDIATAQWGGEWRLPTADEIKELWDNTEREWIDNFVGTMPAVKFIAKNGNSIIIPLAGEMEDLKHIHQNYGFIWASTRDLQSNALPQCFAIVSAQAGNLTAGYAWVGHSVRPVYGQNKNAEIGQEREYVDLGVSSLWAKTNYGAKTETEVGPYLAWGEVQEKSEYGLTNYTYYSGGQYTLSGYLDSEKDIVKKNWGGKWHMPSYSEFYELVNNCDWTPTTKNGVAGYEVRGRGKYSSNSIFLPATGNKAGTYDLDRETGYYWAGEGYYGEPEWAYVLTLSGTNKAISGLEKFKGCAVRPCRDF